jgi:hypothetical protein
MCLWPCPKRRQKFGPHTGNEEETDKFRDGQSAHNTPVNIGDLAPSKKRIMPTLEEDQGP